MKRYLKSIAKKLLPKSLLYKLRFFIWKKNNSKYFPLISKSRYTPREFIKIIATSGTLPRYDGGVKIQNRWIKLLREHNFDAYLATINGQYDKWLIYHQPVIDYEKIIEFRKKKYNIRLLTSWLGTPQLEKIVGEGQFYYIDMELKWTLHFRKKLDYFLKKNKIAGIATHSRYIQSFYIAEYGITPTLINDWSDTSIFYEDSKKRIPGRIGCMIGWSEDESAYEFLAKRAQSSGVCEKVIKIQGNEKEVADTMRTVDIFVGLNWGKHPLWGEGCPIPQQEALHCGCVLVAYDCLGNREYLYDGWTGLIVPKGNKEALWEKIEFLLNNTVEKERLRKEGLRLAKSLFSEEGKFKLISSFLELEEIDNEELSSIFPKPFWLHREEIPYLAKLSFSADKTIVEIGCAYGGATVIFLLNKKPNVRVYSIDPFIMDTSGKFCADYWECKDGVRKALWKKGKLKLLGDWTLIKDYSYNVAKTWNKEIDLLFIDGSHKYEDVKRDFELWSRFLSSSGKILLHDSRKDNLLEDPEDKIFSRGWKGPTQLANEIEKLGDFELIDTCYSITVFKRRK